VQSRYPPIRIGTGFCGFLAASGARGGADFRSGADVAFTGALSAAAAGFRSGCGTVTTESRT